MEKAIIIKRKGHTEEFDIKKSYASIYASALNAHYNDEKAEKLAEKISNNLKKWITKHSHINTIQIRNKIINELHDLDIDVEVMYKHHHDIC